MKFQKGNPKPANSGRKKGSLNKKKIPKVADFLAQKDINPAEQILSIIEADKKLPPADRMSRGMLISVWMDLLSYCQAKPKETDEDTSSSDEEIADALKDVTDATLLKIVKSDGAT